MKRAYMIPVLLVGLAGPSSGALAATACEDDVAHFEQVSETEFVSEETRSAVMPIVTESKGLCEQGKEEESRERLSDAWAMVVDRSEPLVPAPDTIQQRTCADGIRMVRDRFGSGGRRELVQDGVESLIADAESLCAQGEPSAAESKLAMAWTMLTEMPK